ncbi:MAG TPA: methylated-DNA--[protein]-cysteine S-methyltransferase [Thermoplasmata archaeon]|nr:methylated-DNA--[protein]-cysteine S-methyltransferase [Thermoplasmata archaeon]
MTSGLEYADVPTPIGTFRVVYRDRTVLEVGLHERGGSRLALPSKGSHRRAPPDGSPPRQLGEYFRRKRDAFEVDAEPAGASEFDRHIYAALLKVPAGRTITYGDLAKSAGYAPTAARAVGGAMARNPIPIIIPCHRVVGDAGGLTGFGMGLWRKRWLLDREGAWPVRIRVGQGARDRGQRTLDEVSAVLA